MTDLYDDNASTISLPANPCTRTQPTLLRDMLSDAQPRPPAFPAGSAISVFFEDRHTAVGPRSILREMLQRHPSLLQWLGHRSNSIPGSRSLRIQCLYNCTSSTTICVDGVDNLQHDAIQQSFLHIGDPSSQVLPTHLGTHGDFVAAQRTLMIT